MAPDERIVAEGNQDADADVLFLLYGQRDAWARDALGNRIQARTWLKPDSQLVLGMLAAWQRKRYGQHITTEVQMNSVLRLERPGEAPGAGSSRADGADATS